MLGGSSNSISIMYFNCRSIVPKFDELVCLCSANKPSIVCLTETWLCSDILDSELHIPNYTIVRQDRNRHGGGVAIYINNAFSFKVLLSGPSDLELIIISLQSGRHGNLCVGVFYRPPSSLYSIFDTLLDSLFSINHSYFSNFVLLGDFNVNFANPDDFLYNKIVELMDSFVFSQVVTSPTHTSPNSEPSTIDLVFISNMHLFEFCNIIPQLANSDHFGLHVCIKHTSDTTQYTPTTRRKIWRYKHADFNRANDLLMDVDLESIINPYDIQSTWSNWKKIFLDIMDECIPTSILPNRKNLPWLTKDIIQLICKRNNLFKKQKTQMTLQISSYLKLPEIKLSPS